MADGISPLPFAPRPSVEVTSSTPAFQVQPDAAGAIGRTNRDSLEADKDDRTTAARVQAARTNTATNLPASSSEHGQVSHAAAALQGEAALLGTGGAAPLMRAESLGNGPALLLEISALRAAQTPMQLGPVATLAALSLQVPDNVPHLFAAEPDRDGQMVRLQAPDGAGGLRAVEVSVADGRLGEAGFDGLAPSWPFVAGLALEDHVARMTALMPGADPWALALTAATGREALVLPRGVTAEALFRAMSQANPPLALPVVLRMDGGAAFVVTGTQLGPDGSPLVSLLDVASLFAGGEISRLNVPLAQLLHRLAAAILPDGREGTQLSARHQAQRSALGLTGCCLTNVAGVHGGGGRKASAVRHQGGLLDNRCLTCAAAQQACQPTPG